METVMTEDKKVKKLGMKDIQRDGWEYELTVSLKIDRDTHKATASKDRTEVFEKMAPFIITEQTGELIRQWCEQGIEPPKPMLTDKQVLAYALRTPNEQGLLEKIKSSFTLTADQLATLKPFQAAVIAEAAE